jgi:putative acetyltransferase
VHLRFEEPADRPHIYRIVREAFGRDDEAKLVDLLRETTPPEQFISLVAEVGGTLAGHILFSPIMIENTPAIALAPVAVLPGSQKRGVGTALIRAGLDVCRKRGHRIAVVVGHAEYYPRFGFTSARAFGLEAPFPVRDEVFLAMELVPGALRGVRGMVRYPGAFLTVD